MYDSPSSLAYTGLGTATVGGLVFDQIWLIPVALGTVAVGALLIRFGWRRDKSLSDQ